MSRRAQTDDSIGALARRWLKTQLRVNGDPIASRRENEEAQVIEQRIHDKAQEDATGAAISALLPDSWKRKIESLEQTNEEGRLLREQQRREEHEERPRAQLILTLSGSVNGTITSAVPIQINQPVEPGEALTIDLEPLEPVAIGGHTFLGLLLTVPEYAGPGEYDLSEIEQRTQLDGWDPLWFQLTIDTTDDGLYWTSDYGPATMTVGETAIHLRMPMSNANGIDVDVDARIELPEDF